MSNFLLFIRTRNWPGVLVVIGLAAILVLACGPLSIALSPTSESQTRIAMLVPMLPAIAIAATLKSPLPQQEATAARSLGLLNACHVAVLSVAVLTLFYFTGTLLVNSASTSFAPAQGALSLLRNTLGLTGLALLGYRAFGARIGWAVPVVAVIFPPLLYSRADQDPTQIVTFISQPDDAFVAFVFALTLWMLGFSVSLKWRS